MTAVRILKEQIAKIGYSAIVADYAFSDVFASKSTDRKALVAAFTHTPPSYRNAAFAVIEAQQRPAIEVVSEYRALGAPLLFVVEANSVAVWEVRNDPGPCIVTTAHVDDLPALFDANSRDWSPQSIQRAKSIGAHDRHYQLDFVDLGLLPAIEGELHAKLDRLLNEALAEAIDPQTMQPRGVNERSLFRAVFRFLAAKILQDRGHSLSNTWDSDKIDTVLNAISKYYRLPLFQLGSVEHRVFSAVWHRLRNGINFQNISADDLAFVYENTLVTPDIRKAFGTHSTPRAVAEYAVNRLELWRHDPASIRIYEPCVGAGIFLVSALRRLRELLPVNWTDEERHEFLVQRITGDETDPFAKEVATLSLILADYPNANGWKISETDLFKDNSITQRARLGNVVLCNPPFEPFTPEERLKYPEAAGHSAFKPVVILDAVLSANPISLAFVLPETFIKGKKFKAQRQRIESLYKDVELVSLPDRTFKHSTIRSSLVIAKDLREPDDHSTTIRSTVVEVRDRERFLTGGEPSDSRSLTRSFAATDGNLWINDLAEVWEFLSGYKTLETYANVHRGIEWQDSQTNSFRSSPQKGFSPGIHAANMVRAFNLQQTQYLDTRPQRLRGGAGDLEWSSPKILANAARLSRDPWCFAAAVDSSGLVASQQLFGIWPKPKVKIYALCALLNSPVAVGYIASHSPPDRIRVGAVLSIPVPSDLPSDLDDLAKRYARAVTNGEGLFAKRMEQADKLLNQIDAAILKAYDLPPKLERKLLEYFRGDTRPVAHQWQHWLPADFKPYIPLHRYFSEEYRVATSGRVLKVFKPLPKDEITATREYMD